MTYSQATQKAIKKSNVNHATDGGKDYDAYTVFSELNDFGRRTYGIAKNINYLTKMCYDLTTEHETYYQGEEY